MGIKKVTIGYIASISEQFKKDISERRYSLAFKRWLVREINEANLTRNEAVQYFQVTKPSLNTWIHFYSDAHELPLLVMTAAEKTEKKALEQRIKDLEAQLARGQMHVKALNTFIDIAEDQLKISIRKKSGAKQ